MSKKMLSLAELKKMPQWEESGAARTELAGYLADKDCKVVPEDLVTVIDGKKVLNTREVGYGDNRRTVAMINIKISDKQFTARVDQNIVDAFEKNGVLPDKVITRVEKALSDYTPDNSTRTFKAGRPSYFIEAN